MNPVGVLVISGTTSGAEQIGDGPLAVSVTPDNVVGIITSPKLAAKASHHTEIAMYVDRMEQL